MAKTLNQYRINIVRIEDLTYNKNNMLSITQSYLESADSLSRTVSISEQRLFRMFCPNTFETEVVMKDKLGNDLKNDAGEPIVVVESQRDAREFVVLDMSKAANSPKLIKKYGRKIKEVLRKGFEYHNASGETFTFKRVVASASQTRVSKRLFTSLDPAMVRLFGSYGAKFDDKEVIMKMEARYGQMTSTTHEIQTVNREFSFDIMPDMEHSIDTTIERYDLEQDSLVEEEKALELTPLDGQGTILPTAAVDIALNLELIGEASAHFMKFALSKDPDVSRLVATSKKFAKLWTKVPSAFQIRFGFAKGLLVVFPHNLPEFAQDCNKQKYRDSGKCMSLLNDMDLVDEEGKHYYDFSKDIMFTDSQWKANFDTYYLSAECPVEKRVPLEIVLYQKSKAQFKTFMGYQYWQALKPIDIRVFAKREIDRLKDTVFSNADDAKAFLSLYDTGNESSEQLDYGEKMERAGGRIQKIMEVLSENPDMINERYIQSSLRKIFEKFIERMALGRIPVDGANPYIISSPECQFGLEPYLQKGESYYNNRVTTFAGFRSPLIHKSEAVVLDTVQCPDYQGMLNDVFVMNIFEDTLPRMGGADTDGDKIAIVEDKTIIEAVHTGLPMLYDEGANAPKAPVCDEEIYESDRKSILEESKSIGELTNYATSFKDLAESEALKQQYPQFDSADADTKVKILRFMQGWSIDFAKTGFFPMDAFKLHGLELKLSPNWHPWSRNLAEFDEEAKVYHSHSQLGRLSRAIKKYLASFKAMKNFKSKDFTLEMTEAADKNDMDRIKPAIEALEHSYRMEVASVLDGNTDSEEGEEFIKVRFSQIIEKYERAMLSIDADVATIAATAYDVAYHANGTNGKTFSFPWLVAYDGLLMNICKSTTTKTKLRKVFYEGHIDNIPEELKFFKKESKGDNYTVKATVANGTYKTYRYKGQLFVKVAAASKFKTVQKRAEALVPEQKHMAFSISGFQYSDKTASQVINLLRSNNTITIKKLRFEDDNALRLGVFVGEERIGSVVSSHVSILKDYVPFNVSVNNVGELQSSFFSVKRQRQEETKAFNLDTVFVESITVEDESAEESYSVDSYDNYDYADDHYYGDSYGYEQETVVVEDEVALELDDQSLHLDPTVVSMIDTNQEFWMNAPAPEDKNITAMSVEFSVSKKGAKIAVVTMTKDNGKSLAVKCGYNPNNGKFQFNRELPQWAQDLVQKMYVYEAQVQTNMMEEEAQA